MASSNLPPGVTESMIPGNRPEDEWWDVFLDHLTADAPFDIGHDPIKVARIVGNYMGIISRLNTAGLEAVHETLAPRT